MSSGVGNSTTRLACPDGTVAASGRLSWSSELPTAVVAAKDTGEADPPYDGAEFLKIGIVPSVFPVPETVTDITDPGLQDAQEAHALLWLALGGVAERRPWQRGTMYVRVQGKTLRVWQVDDSLSGFPTFYLGTEDGESPSDLTNWVNNDIITINEADDPGEGGLVARGYAVRGGRSQGYRGAGQPRHRAHVGGRLTALRLEGTAGTMTKLCARVFPRWLPGGVR